MTKPFTLICSGLLGPLPLLPQPRPAVPALDRLIGRATRRVAPASFTNDDPLAAVLAHCGVFDSTEREMPTAALSVLGEESAIDATGYWFHADPVHLRADRERLLCFAGAAIAPNRAEADALVTLFNAHFANDGLQLIAPTPTRWYLRVAQPLQVQMPPLTQIQGRALETTLVRGADARRWHSLLNEVQMLFFNSAVNHARERQRRPVISGIWTWGGGELPVVPSDVAIPAIFIGEHSLLRGLARHFEREHLTLAQWRERVPIANSLMYREELATALSAQDLTAWTTALLALNADLAATVAQLRSGALTQMVINACYNNQLHVIRGRAVRWKFWQRRKFFEEVSHES
ncbi:hypothetical protein CKO09_01990 [Chromatium weissei]|nr:hypothetical protein [Chromatium weissei]